MTFFGGLVKTVKNVALGASHVVKSVGRAAAVPLMAFAAAAPHLGNVASAIGTAVGHPNVGASLNRGINTAGKIAGVSSLASHAIGFGNMNPVTR